MIVHVCLLIGWLFRSLVRLFVCDPCCNFLKNKTSISTKFGTDLHRIWQSDKSYFGLEHEMAAWHGSALSGCFLIKLFV